MAKDPKSEVSHRSRINSDVLAIEALFNETIAKLIRIIVLTVGINYRKLFSFKDYIKISKNADDILNEHLKKMQFIIERGSTREWWEAMSKKDTRRPETDIYNSRNKQALKSFQSRVEGGLKLSDRVWNYTQQFKEEIELAISAGIEEGMSASTMTKNVKSYLKEPNKLFRRVRNKFGVLELSKKARAYKPGQGVYRSSYKNALRLTRTEVNMSYRTSDHVRWSNDPTVVGFEVKLSNRHKVRDICDDLKGKYPKNFLYKGWHPQCLCYKVPILISDEEFNKYQESILKGKEASIESTKAIQKVPKEFDKWVEDNKERSKKWNNQPYFVQDNFKERELYKGLK